MLDQSIGRSALDAVAGVAGRELDRVSPQGTFGGHHGVKAGSFGKRSFISLSAR
jgi:hypothetical protein